MNKEETYRALFESSPDGLIVINFDGKILLANKQVEEMFGYSLAELTENEIEILVPQKHRAEHATFRNSYLSNPVKREMGANRDLVGCRKDGSEFAVEIMLTRIDSKEGMFISAVIRDITERKKSDEILKEKERFLNETQQIANLGTYSLNVLNGLWTSSEILDQIFGIDGNYERSIEGWQNIVHPEWREIMGNYFLHEVINNKSKFDKEYKIIKINNHEARWVHGIGLLKFDEANNPIAMVGTIRDITERKQAEESQRFSDERLRMIFKTLSEGVALNEIIFNDQGVMIDHRIMAVNDAFYKVANYNQEVPVVGSLASELYGFTEAETNWFWETHKNATETTKLEFYSELKHRHFSVSVSPFKDNRFVTSFEDVTDRKLAEESRKISEEKYHNIFENVQDVFYQTNLAGFFVEISPSIKDLCGFLREELIGTTVDQIYYNIDDRELLIQTMLKNGALLDYELKLKTKTGAIKNVSINARLIFDAEGKPTHMNGAMRDITERKKNELEIANQNKELEQFAYIASHDLQEPLYTLISISELIRDELKDELNETTTKYLNFITQSSGRMQELVKGLLDYSRIGKERTLTLVDCNKLVNEVLDDLNSAIDESKAQIVFENLPTLKGYSTELRLLFQNLISNSLKFKNKNTSPEIHLKAISKIDHWLFSITDNGIGIDANDIHKIFIIFKRLHNRNDYAGTGIGLSHCKKIVELHGGTIWVESELGKGSTFYFTISKL